MPDFPRRSSDRPAAPRRRQHDSDDDIPAPASGDGLLRDQVRRIARSVKTGGWVVERAAILAEGSASTDLLDWIERHDGEPEVSTKAAAERGVHATRQAPSRSGSPARYHLPASAFAPST